VLSQPSGAAFAISEVFWIGIHLLLLIGVVGLALSGVAPGWFGGIALGIALLGRVDFVLAEIHSLSIGDDTSFLLPLGALITAVGMTLVGIAVLRANRWGGWQRFMPLVPIYLHHERTKHAGDRGLGAVVAPSRLRHLVEHA
jgi:hypothetical protein